MDTATHLILKTQFADATKSIKIKDVNAIMGSSSSELSAISALLTPPTT